MNAHWYEVSGGGKGNKNTGDDESDIAGPGQTNGDSNGMVDDKNKLKTYSREIILLVIVLVLVFVVMNMMPAGSSNANNSTAKQSDSVATSDEELLTAGEGALAWGEREGALTWGKREGARVWDSVLSGLGWKPRDRALTWNKESASASADEELLMAEGALTYAKEGAYGCNASESALTYAKEGALTYAKEGASYF